MRRDLGIRTEMSLVAA